MFNIGDRVKVRPYELMPLEAKNRGIARLAGKTGEVVDVVYSQASDCYLYKLHLDEYATSSRADFTEGTFDLLSETPPKYSYEFEFLDTVVIARLYEETESSKIELAVGHGHIFHEGVVGVAQAASYALKRIFFTLKGED